MVTITWLGHATVLIEVDGTRLLTDPVLGRRVGPLVRIAPPIAKDAVGELDGVLLSHLHHDHTHLWSLRGLEGDPQVLAPPGAGDWLRGTGLPRVRELGPGDTACVAGVRVRATEAMHDDGRRWLGPRAQPVGFVIGSSPSVYFAGDTDLFDAMADLRGKVDVALLPVSGWGPRVGPGHLDPQRAAQATAIIAPRVAIPVHYGTLARPRPARRPGDPLAPGRRFAEAAAEMAPDVEVRILAPGAVTRFG